MRVAINGFGRIGRAVTRLIEAREGIELVHINDLAPTEMLAYLLRRDSVHGSWDVPVVAVPDGIQIAGRVVPVTKEKDPSKLPWAALDVDVVLECTGAFTTREQCAVHLAAGAKRVLLSAPAKGPVDATIVVGVNDDTYDASKHFIVSCASCTTNCLAPLVKALHEAFGILRGTMTTIHAYTMDQALLDSPHRKGDFTRGRAAAINIVPTSTGAAKAIGLVYPPLAGKLDGLAIRVPVPDGSLTDLDIDVAREVTLDEVKAALHAAALGPMRGVLEVSDDPLVSSDIVGNPHSCIVDAHQTYVIDGRMVKVLAWYDNEWGFANRMVDLALILGGTP